MSFSVQYVIQSLDHHHNLTLISLEFVNIILCMKHGGGGVCADRGGEAHRVVLGVEGRHGHVGVAAPAAVLELRLQEVAQVARDPAVQGQLSGEGLEGFQWW